MMGKVANFVYHAVPGVVQNALVSLYGAKESYTRFGRDYDDLLKRLLIESAYSGREIEALQNEKLKSIVQVAAKNVPYYRDYFYENNIAPSSVNIDNFTDLLPILDKSTILDDPKRFCDQSAPNGAIELFTSGSSGSPMAVHCSRLARQTNYAFYEKLLMEYGARYTDKSVTFAGRTIVLDRVTSKYWRKDLWNKTLYCSSFHISPETIPLYIGAIENWKPVFIDSYPSAIGEIAKYIVEHKVEHSIRPRFVLTSSETLLDSQRNVIEEAFKCPVVDQYGCTEMAIWAVYSSGAYRVDPLYSLVELESIDVENNLYDVVTTGLINEAMPLLRYRIGDCVSIVDYGNPVVGFELVTFSKIEGRIDDVVVTPEGRRVGRLDPVFKGLSKIREAQIVQHEIDRLEVVVVTIDSQPLSEALKSVLINNIHDRTSKKIKISITNASHIEKTKTGKIKSVVSKMIA